MNIKQTHATFILLVAFSGCSPTDSDKPVVAKKGDANASKPGEVESSGSVQIPPDSSMGGSSGSGTGTGTGAGSIDPNANGGGTFPGADTGQLPQGNSSMLDVLKQLLGRQIGDGQCQTLVAKALETVNATQGPGFSTLTPGGIGLTSMELAADSILPGDIVRWAPNSAINYLNGKQVDPTQPATIVGKDGHAGIVFSVSYTASGKPIIVSVDQNAYGIKSAQKYTHDFSRLSFGSVSFHRPILKTP